jgi:hypothetical protein
MDGRKIKALEAAGFQVGEAEDFLELTAPEREMVALRIRLGRATRERRESQRLTQGQVAKRMNSTQPRVAKIEAAAPDVSLDLMFRGFFATGGRFEDLATIVPERDKRSTSARRPASVRKSKAPTG